MQVGACSDRVKGMDTHLGGLVTDGTPENHLARLSTDHQSPGRRRVSTTVRRWAGTSCTKLASWLLSEQVTERAEALSEDRGTAGLHALNTSKSPAEPGPLAWSAIFSMMSQASVWLVWRCQAAAAALA